MKMTLKRVLIVNKKFAEAGLEVFKNKVELTILPYSDDQAESLPEIKRHIQGVHGVIWNTKHKLTGEILSLAGPQLKAISTSSSGMDHVDVEEVRKRGILLGNSPKVQDNSVADITVGLLIAAARRFKEGVDEVMSGNWKYGVQWTLGQDISDSTIGIVGLGGIGQTVARRLKGFDVARILYSGHRDKPGAKSLDAERVPLDQLLRQSDYVILSCPLNEETKHMINSNSLGLMKKNSILINIARGGVVDHDALYEALKEQRLFAAGLDVTSPEPLPKDHKLLSLPNCYVLPHIGSATVTTRNRMAAIAARNVLAGLDGMHMESPVVDYN